MIVFPVGIDVRLRSRPIGNYALLIANIAIFLAEGVVGRPLIDALLPPLHADVPVLSEYLTYQFRHGDFAHLLGNMLFLWVFGNAVCDRLGSLNYVVFYLAGGIIAGVGFAYGNDNHLVGASGSIAAVTTAFMVLYPRVNVTLLVWFFIVTMIPVPSMALIVLKIILWDNIISPRLSGGMISNVAYSAHLTGYAFGFIVVLTMLAIRALPRNHFDLLGLIDRWRRRTGMTPDFIASPPERARPSRPPPPSLPVVSEAERLREDIIDRIDEHDFAEAVHLYRRLRAEHPQVVLPRAQQLDVANYLAQSHHRAEAADAYEQFIAAYPNAPDVAQVRLLLGLVYLRRLNEPRRAAVHLRAALDGLTHPEQRQVAIDELERIDPSLGEDERP